MLIIVTGKTGRERMQRQCRVRHKM